MQCQEFWALIFRKEKENTEDIGRQRPQGERNKNLGHYRDCVYRKLQSSQKKAITWRLNPIPIMYLKLQGKSRNRLAPIKPFRRYNEREQKLVLALEQNNWGTKGRHHSLYALLISWISLCCPNTSPSRARRSWLHSSKTLPKRVTWMWNTCWWQTPWTLAKWRGLLLIPGEGSTNSCSVRRLFPISPTTCSLVHQTLSQKFV